jgi:hypothetical protein
LILAGFVVILVLIAHHYITKVSVKIFLTLFLIFIFSLLAAVLENRHKKSTQTAIMLEMCHLIMKWVQIKMMLILNGFLGII